MELSLLDYSFIFFLVGFAGMVDSIAGGGGLITVPTYLAFNVPTDLILGTNKAVSTTGTLLAVSRYIHNRAIILKVALPASILAFFGSALGAVLSRYHSEESIALLLILIIPTVLLLSLKRPREKDSNDDSISRRDVIISALMGVGIGTYDGFFGPGTGTFLVFGFLYLLHFSARSASANARIINFASNLGALLVFASQLKVYVPVYAVAASASLVGNYLGSHLVLKNANKVVRPIYFLVLGTLLVKMIWERI